MSPEETDAATLLYRTLEGPIRFALLDWAFEERIFDLCEETAQADALAEETGGDPKKLLIALRALAAAGFLDQQQDGFRTPPALASFVTTHGTRSLVVNLRAMASLRHAGLSDLYVLLRPQQDGAAPRPPLFDAAHWDRTYNSLSSFHKGVFGDVMETALVQLPEWTHVKRVLDVGAGSTVLASRLIRADPEKHVTLFDLPPVAERLKAALPKDETRIDVVPGNYNETLPTGPFDLILCSLTLYFRNESLDRLLARLANSLAPGGLFVSLHEALEAGRSQPSEHVLGRMTAALRHGDVSFQRGEIAAAMEKAGLTRINSREIATPFGRFQFETGRRKDPHD
ncbi:class I SAM-dependent methyltransferase [Labrenzia aggregata]|uniref:Class I SAM-dependent methyltransferase n=2 Tax=Roseibium aggregatum TaxID=187304 RepID=A0A939J1W6_9HYPH|nr:class I SAM-dependent methyltransferase [Roseibium aggregatum]